MNILNNTKKSGGTKDHFRRVKVLGTATYWKSSRLQIKYFNFINSHLLESLREQIFPFIVVVSVNSGFS